MATVADLTLEELETLVERILEKKLDPLTSPPITWLPDFFETFGSFRETPLERELFSGSKNRSKLR